MLQGYVGDFLEGIYNWPLPRQVAGLCLVPRLFSIKVTLGHPTDGPDWIFGVPKDATKSRECHGNLRVTPQCHPPRKK